ncbi:MAG: carboxypeptidase regulatory-like domain-containing protein [Candidatus Thermoplasmatota archaeon]|nr:carboxypeptidase regulatory-like domain-containing protein [Candidatus Thermoplasmatota archaeon]
MKTEFVNQWKSYAAVLLICMTALLPVVSAGLPATIQPYITSQETGVTISNETEYWALLVAVGVYADDPGQNRPDMLLEVDDLYDLLVESEWWSEDHIKTIKGKDATVTNIIAGFRWLDRMEDADDISLVYLTTHGFPLGLDIPPADEADGTDEALVSYWGFAYEKLFLWDDLINVLLNRLESKGVCLIVDSCYAGGFNDPPNWNLTENTPEVQQTAADWVTGFGEEVRGQNRVVLMASSEDEVSYSGGFGPYIIDGLRGHGDINNDNIVTAEEAFYYAQPRSFDRQHPTMYDGFDGELPLMTNVVPLHSSGQHQPSYQHTIQPSETSSVTAEENSVLCGYITDANTTAPLANALVYVWGRLNNWEYYENQTMANATGFYSMNTPAIRLRITASVEGYCDRTVGPYQMYENQTQWVNLSLYERPLETALVCGYITDEQTSQPLEAANISLSWYSGQQQHYDNQTSSDSTGFYQMSVAAGYIDLDIEKDGYFRKYLEELVISEDQTLWVNVSLNPRPVENAIICGYITADDTGLPLPGTQIEFQWVNIDDGTSYQKDTDTNASGFYSIALAPGEVYMNIHRFDYEYYDPYRHNAIENETVWVNCSLTPETIEVEIAKPLCALYRNNERLMPFIRPRIIGPIDIEAYIPGGWGGPGGDAEKVEFYIDDVLQETITEQPYNWTWSKKTMGKHVIKVVAYDFNGDIASDELEVFKLL